MKIFRLNEVYGRRVPGSQSSQAPSTPIGDTKTPLEVMAAAVAAIQVRGDYVPASQANGVKIPTATDVRSVLWKQDLTAPTPEHDKIEKTMTLPAVEALAKLILDWFNALDPAVVSRNEFMSNAKSVVGRGAITIKQAGFVVALYGTYDRQVGVSKIGAPTVIRDWPQEWGEVKMLYRAKATVRSKRPGRYTAVTHGSGSYFQLESVLPSGHLFRWIVGENTTIQVGQEIEMTGYLEPTVRNPPTISFVPERRFKIMLSRKFSTKGTDEDADNQT